MIFESSIDFARKLDHNDPLIGFREKFYIPQSKGKNQIYFCGNSLGLQPRSVSSAIAQELEDWKQLGVEGHFHGRHPWFEYHKLLKPALRELTGAADQSEVTPMGSLTTNLHLLLVSFYRPTNQRFKILVESGAFPSDQYAIETQCRWHGLDPQQAIVEVSPEAGAYLLSTDKIVECIERHQDQLALVLLGGVQYYTGQFFDIKTITEAGHRAGARVGWDLAHAVGNVPLNLHHHQVDFAVWCSYKYLNSGPGGTAGIFVHQRHGDNQDLIRFGGWWGYPQEQRFEMKKGFIPSKGSDGWQLSNVNILSLASQKASLDIFQQAGMESVRSKSRLLTGFLEHVLTDIPANLKCFQIITPSNPEERGAQLSLLFNEKGKKVFRELTSRGVVVDWREPDLIRVSPVALYNSFQEVFEFSRILKNSLE